MLKSPKKDLDGIEGFAPDTLSEVITDDNRWFPKDTIVADEVKKSASSIDDEQLRRLSEWVAADPGKRGGRLILSDTTKLSKEKCRFVESLGLAISGESGGRVVCEGL